MTTKTEALDAVYRALNALEKRQPLIAKSELYRLLHLIQEKPE